MHLQLIVSYSPCRRLIALVVVYEDHPDAQTIHEAHIKVKPPQFQHGRLQAQSNRVSERTIWSYIIQIANALKATHDAGLAVRLIDATKILVTGKNRYGAVTASYTAQALIHVRPRVRLGSCGIVDVLMYDMPADLTQMQQDDLTMLGALIMQLCTGSMGSMHNIQKAVESIGRNYSADLKSVVLFLLSKPAHRVGSLPCGALNEGLTVS